MRVLFCWALTAGCDKQHLARAKLSNTSRCRDQVSHQERGRGFFFEQFNSGWVGERGDRKKIVISQVLLLLNIAAFSVHQLRD